MDRHKWILFALLFQLFDNVESLDPRSFVTLNPVTPLGFGIQITVPVSFFMPNLGFFGRHSRAGRQFPTTATSFHRKSIWRRSGGRAAILEDTCSDDGAPVEYYLHLLQIDMESCQERFVCEIAADPVKFQPLSDIILRKLARAEIKKGSHWTSTERNSSSSERRRDGHHDLVLAARRGVQSYGAVCSKQYGDCPSDAESMVNLNLLFIWRLISSTLNIRMDGEVFD